MSVRKKSEIEINGNIRAKEASKYLSIGLSTFWLWVKQGKIKPPIKHSPRVSVWNAEYIKSLAEEGILKKHI